MNRLLLALVATASLFVFSQSAFAQADLVATYSNVPSSSVKSSNRATPSAPAVVMSIVPTIETTAANRHMITLPVETASTSGLYQLEVYNEEGHLVMQQSGVRGIASDNSAIQLPVPPMRTGIYSVRVLNDRFLEIHNQKLVYQSF